MIQYSCIQYFQGGHWGVEEYNGGNQGQFGPDQDQVLNQTLIASHAFLLPPKLQRRGLVFKGKLVTMERV